MTLLARTARGVYVKEGTAMIRFKFFKNQAAAKKAANGMPFLRAGGRYLAAPGAKEKAFKSQKLLVLYSPSGRIVASFNISAAMKKGGRARELKTELVRRLLRKRGGTTRAEVLRKTGWSAVSMQDAARHVGLRLKIKGANPMRYFGVSR